MLNIKPIGVFDSGIGGLSVSEKIFTELPDAQIIYVGDTARVPYGGKTSEELIGFADEITKFLIDKGCGIIVDACNSTSAVAIDFLQKKYNNPIIGVIEPGIKGAINATKNGRIGLIATEATVKSGAHKKAARLVDPKIKIYSLACPDFVPLVEAGEVTGENTMAFVTKALEPLKGTQIDTLILGCTHYPYLAKVIKTVMGDGVTLVDPANETTKEIKKLYTGGTSREHQFYVTGNPEQFQKVGEILTRRKLPLIRKVII